jgi:hypothetical protein
LTFHDVCTTIVPRIEDDHICCERFCRVSVGLDFLI